MIVTVNLNPVLDRTLALPHLTVGQINRAQLVRLDVGGKGFNVSRALLELGTPSLALGVLGGATGEMLRRGLEELGIAGDFVFVEGETRQNLTLLDESTGLYTKVNEAGPQWTQDTVESLLAKVRERVAPDDVWVMAGRLPPGAPPDLLCPVDHPGAVRGPRPTWTPAVSRCDWPAGRRPTGSSPTSKRRRRWWGTTWRPWRIWWGRRGSFWTLASRSWLSRGGHRAPWWPRGGAWFKLCRRRWRSGAPWGRATLSWLAWSGPWKTGGIWLRLLAGPWPVVRQQPWRKGRGSGPGRSLRPWRHGSSSRKCRGEECP